MHTRRRLIGCAPAAAGQRLRTRHRTFRGRLFAELAAITTALMVVVGLGATPALAAERMWLCNPGFEDTEFDGHNSNNDSTGYAHASTTVLPGDCGNTVAVRIRFVEYTPSPTYYWSHWKCGKTSVTQTIHHYGVRSEHWVKNSSIFNPTCRYLTFGANATSKHGPCNLRKQPSC